MGLTLETLDELGLVDNTIVVFSSDHGDQLFEHGMTEKNVFFEASVHVPLMIRFPDRVRPGAYEELVETTDFLASIMALCGLDEPYDNQGRSVAPLIDLRCQAAYEPRKYVFCENIIPEVIDESFARYRFEKGKGVGGIRHPDAKMVRSDRYKYNHYVGQGDELYDLVEDPGEFRNLAGDPDYRRIVDELKGAMLDWLITANETDQIEPTWGTNEDV